MVLLRVRDEDGVVGLGEAVPLALRGGVGLREVVRELERWGEDREVDGLSAPSRCALGPEVRIRVDANEAWDLETAKTTLAELEPFGIELAEQPVAGLEAMAELAALTSIPLAADESVASLAEAEEAAALDACSYTGIKLSKVGGPEAALAIADVIPSYVTSALDGPVGIAAAAQVALSLAETTHPERLHLAHGLATQRLF